MRLLFIFAQCFLASALLMAQVQPSPDGSVQARNKAVAMRHLMRFLTRESSKWRMKSTRPISETTEFTER
jgi:hypothetical protein